jgi:beta-N-acetylhexosaminidase
MVGLPGKGLDDTTAVHLAAGGRAVILMGRNVYDPEQIISLTNDVACAAGEPVLIATDQELGPVARLRGLVTPLPGTTEAMEMLPIELELTGQLLGLEMLELGINMDLAPVLDVVRGPNPVLAFRHLGDDPERVAELGVAFMRGLRQAGVVAVPKHFPGHGLSVTDPHGVVTTIDAPLEELQAIDLVPFRAAIDDGAQAVMLGHPIYGALDPALPASISPTAYTLLRADLGFGGVAVTDSLTMQAVRADRTIAEAAVAAVAAGADLALVVDSFPVEEMVAGIVAAVESGRLPLERLQEASARVAALAERAGRVLCGA